LKEKRERNAVWKRDADGRNKSGCAKEKRIDEKLSTSKLTSERRVTTFESLSPPVKGTSKHGLVPLCPMVPKPVGWRGRRFTQINLIR
jgi:hypothetical protein